MGNKSKHKKRRGQKPQAGGSKQKGEKKITAENARVAPSGGAETKSPVRGSGKTLPLTLFLICFVAYLINGDFDPGGDQQGNMLFSVNLLKYHSFSVTPERAPAGFTWTYKEESGEERQIGKLKEWNRQLHDAYRNGDLTPTHQYYLTPTKHPGRYANTFGMGAPVAGLPVYAFLNLFTDVDSNPYWWWYGSKLSASLLIAFAAVLLFLSARFFVASAPAVLIALTFALGSCVWTTSSQALWQHPANTFFLALGAYFLCGAATRKHFAAYCGLALGMAVLCRPTGAVVVVCAGLYLLVANRRLFMRYALGGLPVAAALAAYNLYYFDNLFHFGQIAASESIALAKTGVADVWQTPIWLGLSGLLFSPSRGLLFFSPVLLFGFAGAVMAWKDRSKYAPLIPLQVATVLLLLVAAHWFDWWGGWAYGYRPIVDVMVFIALLMAPAMEKILRARRLFRIFITLLVWSVSVQFIGAFSYNGASWNYRDKMNIDQREHQRRLWSLADNQIVYYATHFGSARRQKRGAMDSYIRSPMPVVVHPPIE